MKGLTHYLLGIAVASFFVDLVQLTWQYKSLLLLLGGFFAILPDTLDFRFAKFMQRHDYEMYLDVRRLNLEEIADIVKEAIERSAREKREINIKFHTVKVGPDLWRSYIITLNEDSVKVSTGPIVTTGKEVVSREGEGLSVEKKIGVKLRYDYDKDIVVDILSGPDLSFVPEGSDVRGIFIPWHRKWSHSVTAAALAGLVGSIIGILLFGPTSTVYYIGLMCFSAYISHVVSDHFGMMGSNFFPPFTKRRIKGFGLTRSMSIGANIVTNYISFIVILWNFNAFGPRLVFDAHWNSLIAITPSSNFILWYLVGLTNMFVYFVLPVIAIYLYITRGRKITEKEEKSEVEESDNV